MKKYIVIALSVGGMGNKIFRCNDVVNEDQFLPGRADELVESGFLREEKLVSQPSESELKAAEESKSAAEAKKKADEEAEFQAALAKEKQDKEDLQKNVNADQEAKKKLSAEKSTGKKGGKNGK